MFLFHSLDDVIDESKVRKGQPTSNEIFGTVRATTCAAFNFFNLQHKILELTNYDREVIKVYTDVYRLGYHTEALDQVWKENSYWPTEFEFITNITRKNIGVARFPTKLLQHFSDNKIDLFPFLDIFMVYAQLRDDHLDLFMPEEKFECCEIFAHDLVEGKPTLPLIHAIHEMKNQEIIEIMSQKEKPYELRQHCVQILKQIGSMDYSRNLLELCDEELRKQIKEIGPNPMFERILDHLKDWKN
jgi:octaprenyl-diphosphate synthase